MGSFPRQIATGALLGWPKVPTSDKEHWMKLSEICDTSQLEGDWQFLEFRNPPPLTQESILERYPFLLRGSENRAVLFSTHTNFVYALLNRAGLGTISIAPRVKVDELVDNFSGHVHSHYALSMLYARVGGFGESLETISLYGQDILTTGFFQRIKTDLTPFRVELKDLRTNERVLSISNRGEISFAFGGQRSLTNVTNTLRYLTSEGYIDWPQFVL